MKHVKGKKIVEVWKTIAHPTKLAIHAPRRVGTKVKHT